MKVKDVVILKEVADDLNDGKAFYDQRESGVGDDPFLKVIRVAVYENDQENTTGQP